ncbi:MAG: hypothetical protein JSW33_05140 [bacterium]|nr:MAG: hypothetical protein JSW33_05140 [bacterium]
MNKNHLLYAVIVFILLNFLLIVRCKENKHPAQVVSLDYSKDYAYKCRWNPNPEPDMSHYLLFAWNGSDTTQSPFSDNSSASRYSSYKIKEIVHKFNVPAIRDTVEYVANGNWLQFAVAAVNQSGAVSTIGVSNYLKSEDLRTASSD